MELKTNLLAAYVAAGLSSLPDLMNQLKARTDDHHTCLQPANAAQRTACLLPVCVVSAVALIAPLWPEHLPAACQPRCAESCCARGSQGALAPHGAQVKARDSFELGFNRACGLVEGGQFAAAEGEIRMALKQGAKGAAGLPLRTG